MKKYAGLLLIVLILEAVLTGVLPHTQGMLFKSFEEESGNLYLFYIGISFFIANYLSLHLAQTLKPFLQTRLGLGLRTHFTTEVTTDIKKSGRKPIHPDSAQRIQEDTKVWVLSSLTAYSEYFVSSIIIIQLIYLNLDHMVLAASAVLFSIISVSLGVLFNPALVAAEKKVQTVEAAYRNALGAEITDIKLLESANISIRYSNLVNTYYSFFTGVQLSVMRALPFLILAPMFFAHKIGLGDMMKHAETFGLIAINASILIYQFPVLMKGKASMQRFKEILK